jgi:hypothetical protein
MGMAGGDYCRYGDKLNEKIFLSTDLALAMYRTTAEEKITHVTRPSRHGDCTFLHFTHPNHSNTQIQYRTTHVLNLGEGCYWA